MVPGRGGGGGRRRYEVVGTTADVAIRAFGESHRELFTNAAYGMADLICDTTTVHPKVAREVVASAPTPERLMVAWLTELLVLFEGEGMVFATFEVEVMPAPPEGKWALRAIVRGEPYEHGRHQILHDVKAVTYHTLVVDPEKGVAMVLFDI